MPAPFEKLKVWQLSHELTLSVYQATAKFPTSERYGLASQLRRAATAVPSNIVEGNARNHRREYLQFCHIARASIAEVKYLLRLSSDLGYLPRDDYGGLENRYSLLGALLQRFIQKLAESPSQAAH